MDSFPLKLFIFYVYGFYSGYLPVEDGSDGSERAGGRGGGPPPPPPPPPNEPRTRSATLRSATLISPPVVATADPPVAPTNLGPPLDVPPWLDTRPPPPDTQDLSQLLLSGTQALDSDASFTVTSMRGRGTTTVAAAPDKDRFFPVTSTRGRGTTTAAAAFLPPATVGIPQGDPSNAYAALDDASSVETPDRHGDGLRTVAGIAAADAESIKALLDKSFDEFFGPDSSPAPTPLRNKGLFDAGARLVDRLLSNIHEEHKRHVTRTDQQFRSIRESAIFTHGALRADVNLLRTEAEEALVPAICNLSGLAALAQKLEQDITGLLETSARTTHNILELRQEIDGCGTLSGLAALAHKSEQDIIGLLETSAKNAQAILELRQEIAGCVAVKTTVNDIKTHQLTQIRENVMHIRTGLADMTTQYSTLNEIYSKAFNAVNIWVDNILREGIPPMTAPTDATATPPVCNTDSSPSSPPTDGASTSPPANVVPDSAPPGDGRMDSGASKDMPRSNAPDRRSDPGHAYHLARPNLPRDRDFGDTGGFTSVRWCPQLDPRRSTHANGTYWREEGHFDNYQGLPRASSSPYFGSHDTRNDLARSDLRQYTAHVPPPYPSAPGGGCGVRLGR